MFSWEIFEIYKSTFFEEQLRTTACRYEVYLKLSNYDKWQQRNNEIPQRDLTYGYGHYLMFYEKGVTENVTKFAANHLCWSLFLRKFQVSQWVLRNF